MNDHVKGVCKIGQAHDCCRYLAMGGEGFECLKNTSLAVTIDTRVMMGTIYAQANNCEGKTIQELNIETPIANDKDK